MDSENSTSESTLNRYACNECDLSFGSSVKRRSHSFSRHPPLLAFDQHGATITVEANDEGVMVCPFCSSRLTGLSSFQNHLSRLHPAEPKPRKLENKRTIEQFSFEDGCSDVLQVSNETKKQQCGGLATYYDLLPVKLAIKKQGSNTTDNNMFLSLFMNNSSQNALDRFIDPSSKFEAQLIYNTDHTTDSTTDSTTASSSTSTT
ncbi:hypothetical protein EDC94DRAFT_645349 [Helicostylum pulchrum]|nr:hypothetical protein EDC94DRAFT_645349 [Helicostylum pulchrum]